MSLLETGTYPVAESLTTTGNLHRHPKGCNSFFKLWGQKDAASPTKPT